MTRPFFSKDRISHFELFDRHAGKLLVFSDARTRADTHPPAHPRRGRARQNDRTPPGGARHRLPGAHHVLSTHTPTRQHGLRRTSSRASPSTPQPSSSSAHACTPCGPRSPSLTPPPPPPRPSRARGRPSTRRIRRRRSRARSCRRSTSARSARCRTSSGRSGRCARTSRARICASSTRICARSSRMRSRRRRAASAGWWWRRGAGRRRWKSRTGRRCWTTSGNSQAVSGHGHVSGVQPLSLVLPDVTVLRDEVLNILLAGRDTVGAFPFS